VTVVLDASVGIALVRPEEASSAARRAVDRWLSERVPLVVPSHFWLEIVNALTRGRRARGAAVIEGLYELDQLAIATIEVDRPTLLGALDLTERWGLTSYDAIYLALAHSLGADLATFDRELIAAGGSSIVDLSGGRSHRTSESPATDRTPTERDVTWPRWSGSGAYLATLRRRAGESPQRVAR
jgi:predicted nucleic acid-binding protein